MRSQTKIIALTVLLSTILAFASHVAIQGWEDKITLAYAHLFESAKNMDKFGINILLAACFTAILPVLASYFVLYFIWNSLPGNTWWKKGLAYCLVLLVLKSHLIREPIMGVIMDVPVWMVVAKQLDVWIPNIILALLLAWGVNLHRAQTDGTM